MFEQLSELCEGNLPISIGVQFLHQGLSLLLVHLVPQLAELPQGYVSTVVAVNCLETLHYNTVQGPWIRVLRKLGGN